MLVRIRDETASGKVICQRTLDVRDEAITVRELIRSRICQEADDHNRRVRQAAATTETPYTGLVVPSETTHQTASAKPIRTIHREIDWRQQYNIACDAFERNVFFVLVDDKQVDSLDDLVTLKAQSQVSFLKLGRLVGG